MADPNYPQSAGLASAPPPQPPARVMQDAIDNGREVTRSLERLMEDLSGSVGNEKACVADAPDVPLSVVLSIGPQQLDDQRGQQLDKIQEIRVMLLR